MSTKIISTLYCTLCVCALSGLMITILAYSGVDEKIISSNISSALFGITCIILAPLSFFGTILLIHADKGRSIQRSRRIALMAVSLIVFCVSTGVSVIYIIIFISSYGGPGGS